MQIWHISQIFFVFLQCSIEILNSELSDIYSKKQPKAFEYINKQSESGRCDIGRFFCLFPNVIKFSPFLFGFNQKYYTFAIVLKGTFSHGTENVLVYLLFDTLMTILLMGTRVPCAASSTRSESERTDTEQNKLCYISKLHNVSSAEEIPPFYVSSHGRF